MRLVATGLLVLMVVVFGVSRLYEGGHPAIGYVRAFAEAAMIGALADWFAVVALFRHPMGLPIPHTAIIPSNQSRIGGSLARFVRESFLTEHAIIPKMKDWRVAHRMALWVKDPTNATHIAASLATTLSGVMKALDDAKVSQFLRNQASTVARRVPVSPVAASVLEALLEHGREQHIISGFLRWLIKFVVSNQEFLQDRIRDELPLGGKAAFSSLRSMIASRVASRLAEKVEQTLQEVLSDPAHALRIHLHAEMIVLSQRLREDPELADQMEIWKEGLLDHKGVMSTSDAIWARLKHSATDNLEAPDSSICEVLAEALQHAGEAIAADPELQEKMESWLTGGVARLMEAYGANIEQFMKDTVQSWDADTLVEKLETEVGADLQFIRINGTLVGGGVGLLIHLLKHWI